MMKRCYIQEGTFQRRFAMGEKVYLQMRSHQRFDTLKHLILLKALVKAQSAHEEW